MWLRFKDGGNRLERMEVETTSTAQTENRWEV